MDKILVVEDDKTVYSGIKKLLELQHYSVVIAQNGVEALEKIDESFSLVIMDIMMPQLDGIETCRRMRERHSVPILFLSAKSEELDKLEGLEVGGDDYMTKPFSNMELISKVRLHSQCSSVSWVECPQVPAIRLCSSRQRLSWFHSRDNNKYRPCVPRLLPASRSG